MWDFLSDKSYLLRMYSQTPSILCFLRFNMILRYDPELPGAEFQASDANLQVLKALKPSSSRLAKIVQITLLLLTYLAYFSLTVSAQDVPFRVMTYNGLKLSGDDTARQPSFQRVFEATQPDILLMQEIVSETGADLILDALNAVGPVYERAPFIDGYDTDNALFYRPDVVAFLGQDTIATALREFSEYRVKIGANELLLYSAHLKASDSPASENKRFDEITILRNHLNELPAGSEFVIVGDMNLYESSEPAYQKLIADAVDNDGRARDLLPDSLVGKWHNNPDFAGVHTQSTRAGQFGGGSSGGVDDRFDFIFGSYELNDSTRIEYQEGSYTAFGNDGLHFNLSINDGVNMAVALDVADALYNASDHLPVFADFVSLDSLPALPPVLFTEILYDTPGTDADEEWIELYNTTPSQIDLSGWSITDNNGTGRTFILPSGLTIGPGAYITLANQSDAFFQLYGYEADVYGSLPALNNNGDALVLFDPLDNEIDRVAWEGGAGAGLPDRWNSATEPLALRGQSVARADIHIDTNTFADWIVAPNNGHPETQNLYVVFAEASSVGTESIEEPALFQLDQNYPNPFSTNTTIPYRIETTSRVTLTVYDMLGREIERLVDEAKPAGAYQIGYNAESLPSGMYVYRLQAESFSETRQFMVVR